MRFFLAAALCFLLLPAPAAASSIKDDEEIVFFTTAARLSGDEWIVPVHAWVFEPERDSLKRRAALAALGKALELDESAAESKIFQERARWFLVDNERGKTVRTSFAREALGPTGANGHAKGEFRFRDAGGGRLSFTALLPADDARVFRGEALLVAPDGISVISDIDDTIKISEVTDKKKLLENTFLKPFAPAPGMAEAYGRLAGKGAAFHYVSSSPWQLYPGLEAFRQEAGFPAGSIHLRVFRMKDSTVFNMMKSSEETKPPVINRLLSDYPQRSFIMIGDSGEKDPEIYGRIARENPGRVRHIYIRRVTPEAADDARYQAAFSGLDASLWTVFDDPAVVGAE